MSKRNYNVLGDWIKNRFVKKPKQTEDEKLLSEIEGKQFEIEKRKLESKILKEDVNKMVGKLEMKDGKLVPRSENVEPGVQVSPIEQSPQMVQQQPGPVAQPQPGSVAQPQPQPAPQFVQPQMAPQQPQYEQPSVPQYEQDILNEQYQQPSPVAQPQIPPMEMQNPNIPPGYNQQIPPQEGSQLKKPEDEETAVVIQFAGGTFLEVICEKKYLGKFLTEIDSAIKSGENIQLNKKLIAAHNITVCEY